MAITAQELNVILSARDKKFTKAMERAQRRVDADALKAASTTNIVGPRLFA